VTCRAAHAQRANGNRLGATVEHPSDFHRRTGGLQEYLRSEEEALRWLEDAFEVRPGEAALSEFSKNERADLTESN